MGEFLAAGGFAMWFVMLFSIITLGAAISFFVRGDLKKLALVRAMTLATMFAILTGVLANILAVARHVAADEALMKSPELGGILVIGVGESITPAILGFAALVITWLVVAAGTRRVQESAD
jgi:hypothetical protein